MVKLAGFPVIYQDELDVARDCIYILTGADAHVSYPIGKATVIYWLLEWYMDYVQKQGISRTWCSNRTFAQKINAQYVPLGSHPDLGGQGKADIHYDIAHMSYADVHRRATVLAAVSNAGVRIAPNGWDMDRDMILRQSRYLVHIHQHSDTPAPAPLRLALAAAYHMPVICENGWDMHPYQGAVIESDYGHLVETIIANAKTDNDEIARRLHKRLCIDMNFRKVVLDAV